jgi:hypothetical protein
VLLAAGRTAHNGRTKSAGVILLAPRYGLGRMTWDIAITRNSFLFLGSAEVRARLHSLCRARQPQTQGPRSASPLADVIDRVA